jgi:HEAT repeat protein
MWIKSTAIWLILAAAAMAQSEEDKKKEEEAKAKIADFKKELKTAKTDKDVARAIEGLGALQHPKILTELKSFLSKGTEVTIAAAEQIGKYKKDKDAAESLVSAAGGQKDKDGTVKCIRYAGDTEYKGIIPKLANLFRNKDVDAAKEAVDSCGKIKSKEAMEPLLNLWRELDGIKEEKAGQGGGLGGGGLTGVGGVGQSMQDDQIKRKRDLTPAVESAIKKITGEDFKDLRAANDWWRKNKGTFKDPE